MEGYNVALKIGGKTIIGRTQDDLTVAANVKETLTKDNAGQKQFSVTGHEVTFKVTGLMEVTGSSAAKMDRDDLITAVLKTGNAAPVAITYEATGGDTYGGNAIITNYTESSNASDDATLSADLKITGAFAKVV